MATTLMGDAVNSEESGIAQALSDCQQYNAPGVHTTYNGRGFFFPNPYWQPDPSLRLNNEFSLHSPSVLQKRPATSPKATGRSSESPPAKKQRNQAPPLAPEKLEKAHQVLAACKNHLSSTLQMDKALPTPAELARRQGEVTQEVLENWSEQTGLPMHYSFLRALCEEIVRENHDLDLVKMAIRSNPRRRASEHSCDTGNYCACNRLFFLVKKGLTIKELQGLVSKCPALRREVEEIAYDEIPCQEGRTPKMFLDEIAEAPHYRGVEYGLNKFIKEVAQYYRKVNALVAIESFSSYVEGYLISKCNRPACNENLFEDDEAKRLLENHPHVLAFHGEVQTLMADHTCISMNDLYDKLYPMFRALTQKRGLNPLPPSPKT